MKRKTECDDCEIADKGEAIFWAGVFVGVLLSALFYFLAGRI
jgi:hypothetical protein